MSELIRGYSAPLFDRLSSAGGLVEAGNSLLTPTQLDASIGRELSHLLNTRSRLTASEFFLSTGSCIDYGVPDSSALSPNSSSDLELLQSTVKQAINYYEPRLNNVTVKAFSTSYPKTTTMLVISGTVTIGLKFRQLNFELQLDSQQGNRAKTI